MKITLEENLPYALLALVVMGVFYGTYLAKQWTQKREGIKTMQIGSRKDSKIHMVETLMGIATVGIIPADLLSIAMGWSHLGAKCPVYRVFSGNVGRPCLLVCRDLDEG